MSAARTPATMIRPASSVLVVSGEPSGDRIAAGMARVLAGKGVRCFGMGGAASERAGVELVSDIRGSAAMGLTEVVGRMPAVLMAFARLARRVHQSPPRAAALVNYTEFNLRLGRFLRKRGIPVLWCVAPQVWAWRSGRTSMVTRAADRMAVVLPFEEPLWRDAGLPAHYVGHPALDMAPVDRHPLRARLGIDRSRLAVALLPGSRAHEVRRHTLPMLEAVRELSRMGRSIEVRLLAAGSLEATARAWLLEAARAANVAIIDVDPSIGAEPWLPAFDATLTASGTATLESALAGAPPVVVYRMSALSAAVARRLLRIPHVALPNILLGEGRYPELLQGAVEPRRMARELARVLDTLPRYAALPDELRRKLAPTARMLHRGPDSSARIVSFMDDWLGPPPKGPEPSRAPGELAHA